VIIRNQGANPVTSATIYYHVNNEEIASYEWTGNLGFMETAEVILPSLAFELLEENNFYAVTVDPNGIPDDYPRNDTLIQPFSRAAITPLTVKLMLRTDSNPQQITWEVLNSTGDVMDSGGPYANANSMYNETMVRPDMECYLFKIYDSGGDGIIIPGFYTLYYGNGTTIKNGTSFGFEDAAYFEVNTQVGITDQEPEINIGIYPNPASNAVNISFVQMEETNVSAGIYDLTGRMVKSFDQGVVSKGDQIIRLATEDINPGLYLIQIEIGQNTYSYKLTIE
jgi:hypothetical protein